MDTYEKKYNEALERAKKLMAGFEGYDANVEIIKNIFPELREDEDERIRKWLVDYFCSIKETVWIHRDITCEQILAWLEKQKEPENTSATTIAPSCWEVEQKEQKPKNILTNDDSLQTAYLKGQTDVIEDPEAYGLQKAQKPAEWSEKDEDRIRQIERIAQQAGCTQKLQEEIHDWLNSLRPQPKVELSEEDKAIVGCIAVCLDGQFVTEAARKQCLEWFNKHRRDFLNSPSWKPSEAQMNTLKEVINNVKQGIRPYASEIDHLEDLYEQLKKL